MDERDEFNRQADDALYGPDGTPREADVYPDSDEAVAIIEQWQEAEALGVDPATLHLLETGGLEL